MKRTVLWLFALIFVAGVGWQFADVPVEPVAAVTEDELEEKRKQVQELQDKLDEVQEQKQSLSQTIDYLSTRVALTESQIAETQAQISVLQQQIADLNGKIDVLDTSLEKLSAVLVRRVNEAYKQSSSQPVSLFMFNGQFRDYLLGYKYLKVSQQNDREIMYSLEKARTDFDRQKTLKEVKQQEVEALQAKLERQQADLSHQQAEKEAALALTRNNERRYQDELARALAELEAIQSIIAGKGEEVSAGEVSQGEVIASIIPGASACSNGGHLHFEVAKDGVHSNPASFLTSKSVEFDNGPDGSFGFSGSWPWPVNDPVRITQGYGMTFYAATLRYYGGAPHTGIDMTSSSSSVKAVQKGILYRGSIACGGGNLRYVRVEHAEDDYSTYYLHVNY